MKRITLLAVLALMVALAVPVMATDFAWNGELTYGSITDGTNVADAYVNAFIAVAGKADANNTFNLTFNAAYAGTGVPSVGLLAGGATTLNAFTEYASVIDLVSDVGKTLSLPFGLVATFGWFEPAATSYSLTSWGYESLIAYDPWGVSHDSLQLVATFGTINVQLAFQPTDSTLQSQALDPQIIGDVYGVMGPIKFSVAYTSNKTKDYMGLAGASVVWTQAFGDLTPAVNAEFSYNLATGAKNPYTIGVGASVAYTTLLTVGVGTSINGAGLGNLGINVNLVPMTGLGIDVDPSLNLSGTGDLVNCIDVSAWYKIGASKVRVGYLYEKTGFGYMNAPANLAPNGGLYATWDLTF